MRNIGIIGLGRNYDHSLGYSIGKQLFQTLGEKELPHRILVNSKSRSTVHAFFEQGIKEILERNLREPEWERRFSYSKKRSTRSVEEIVAGSVDLAGYEQISKETDLAIICLEASLSTIEMTPTLIQNPNLRRNLYSANASELRKITPYFKDYKGMVWMVTNPPGWLCMDFYEHTKMQADQIVGIHPETHRLRDFTGLYRYLYQLGMEVHDLCGMETLYVLGDHGGKDMVVPLSSAVAHGRTARGFDVKQVKEGIALYLNQLANETLQTRKSTSHEIAALINRMVRSYYLEDHEEYVAAVRVNHLGNGEALFSGEPAVFENGRMRARPLEVFLKTEEEKREYSGCLERMRDAWKDRGSQLILRLVPSHSRAFSLSSAPSYLRPKELDRRNYLSLPLFLPPEGLC